MKRILIISFLVAGIATQLNAQSEIEGYWMAGEGKTIVEFSEIDKGAYQGIIVWMERSTDKKGQPFKDRKNPDKSLRNREILGMPMVEKIDYQNGEWTGTIYSPKGGRTVNATFALDGVDKLKVRVSFGGFKRTQVWKRTEAPK